MALPDRNKNRRSAPVVGGGGFEPFAAGKKAYGAGGRPNPNSGRVDNVAAAAGYNVRDTKAAARREALLRRTRGGI